MKEVGEGGGEGSGGGGGGGGGGMIKEDPRQQIKTKAGSRRQTQKVNQHKRSPTQNVNCPFINL